MFKKNLGTFGQKFSLWNFVFYVLIYVQKEFHSYFHWCLRNCFSKVTEKFDRNIAKRAIILHKNIFSKIWKMFLYIHIRNVCFVVIGNNLFSNEAKTNNAQTRYIDTWLYRYWFCYIKNINILAKKKVIVSNYICWYHPSLVVSTVVH